MSRPLSWVRGTADDMRALAAYLRQNGMSDWPIVLERDVLPVFEAQGTCLLPDDDTAVERLEAAIISGWPYDTDIGADPRLARKSAISLRDALREGGQR